MTEWPYNYPGPDGRPMVDPLYAGVDGKPISEEVQRLLDQVHAEDMATEDWMERQGDVADDDPLPEEVLPAADVSTSPDGPWSDPWGGPRPATDLSCCPWLARLLGLAPRSTP